MDKSFPYLFKVLREFAQVCADAYINQYVDPQGLKVFGYPVLYYGLKDHTIGWTSSMNPLREDEILIAYIYKDQFGDIGSDLFLARYLIEEKIMLDPSLYPLIEHIDSPLSANYLPSFAMSSSN